MRALFGCFLLLLLLLLGACSDQEEEGTLIPIDKAWEDLDGCGRREYTDMASLPALYAAGATPPEVPIRLGTPENMQQGLPFDFTGLWWMRDNPFPELLMTLAGLTCPDMTPDWPNDPDFEHEYLQCTWPANSKHMWSWDTSLLIQGFTWLYLFINIITRGVPGENVVRFYNETYGELYAGGIEEIPFIWGEGWLLQKINEDEWFRPSYFKDGSIIPDTNYTLVRIARADGMPTEYFAEFVKFMEERSHNSLLVWDSDSSCKRQCMGYFWCSFCDFVCGSK